MAKKTIFIGNQSNDGTGDSIRDAFDKVNQNFSELYSINNAGTGLFFTKLDDTPKVLTPGAILVNSAANTVTQKILVASTGISIVTTASGIVISNTNSSLFTDSSPKLSANLNGNSFLANNFADPVSNQDLATKKYVDDNGFASSVNLYVSTQSGNDSRTGIKAGRALAYAFKTINKAAQVAEALINSSSVELGPDQKYITYGGSYNNRSTIQTITNSTDIPGNKIISVNYTGPGTDPWISNDMRPGQHIKGMISGAVGFISALTQSNGLERYDVTVRYNPLVAGFQLGEPLMYGSTIATTNITICVESGIYEEQYPIRIPANVSIRGDEFRRVIIRPANGVSTSPWVKTWFRRDQVFDGLTVVNQKFGYHYLTDPNDPNSTPKENNSIDVFLLNDQTILRAVSAQGHGGFMCVLDPEGQILTKSPYIQNCSSISRSINTQTFAGGMFIDGCVGNLEATSTSAGTYYTGTATIHVSGLTKRIPQTPCAFMDKGIRYEIDYVTNWNPSTGDADLHFNPRNPGGIAAPGGIITVNSGVGYSTVPIVQFSPPTTPGGIVAQGTAVKSISGVITQINITNPGFGYVTAPTVKFVGGSPSVPATVTLSNSIIATGYIGQLPATIEIGTAGYKSALAADFTQLNDLGYGIVDTNLAFSELVSVFTYFCHVAYYAANGAQIGSSNGATKYGNYALVSSGADPFEVPIPATLVNNMITTATIVSNSNTWGRDTTNTTTDTTLYIKNWGYVPYSQSLLEIDHGNAVDAAGRKIGRATYTISNASTITNTGTVVQLNLSTSGGSLGALKAPIPDGTNVIIRGNKVFGFSGVNTDTITRPSTALDFLESSTINYHVLNYNTSGLGTGLANITLKEPFSYIQLTPDPAVPLPVSGATTLRINNVSQYTPNQLFISDGERLTNSIAPGGDPNNRFIFGWNNQIHEIGNYISYGSTASITISPALNANISTTTVVLYAGLQANRPAEISTRISLLRATGHDFVGVGAGGRETANIPNDIYGPPRKTPNQSFEVTEIGRGRVFHTSTDQDGNFRVGSLFQINQGTGAATLNASITLTGIEGLGFNRGVVVDEFSSDETMNPSSAHVVPVQSAVANHISHRLGLNAANVAVSKIGSGYLDLTGIQKMVGNLQLNGNSIDMGTANIVNLSDGTLSSDAINKGQLDNGLALKLNLTGGTMTGDIILSSDIVNTDTALKAVSKRTVDKIRQVAAMSDVSLTGVADTDLLMFAGALTVNTTTSAPIWTAGRSIVNVANSTTSNISLARSGNSVAFTINANTITNAMIKSNAAIAQSKLSMNTASTRANATGIVQSDLGLASFDNGLFATTDGWVYIKSPGNSKVLTSNASGNVTWVDFSTVAPSDVTGNAASATKLQTARNINGIAFDGSKNIDINLTNTLTRGTYLTGNNFDGSAATTWAVDGTSTNTVSKVVVRDASGGFSAGTITATLNGSASSLTTARNINGVAFDGTANISINLNNSLTNGSYITGSAFDGSTARTWAVDATSANTANKVVARNASGGFSAGTITATLNGSATSLTTARNINGIAFDGTSDISINLNNSLTNGSYITGSAFDGSTARTWAVDATTDATASKVVARDGNGDISFRIGNGTATSAQYADLAEKYSTDAEYISGTVVIFGGEKEVTQSVSYMDTRLAGVISSNPAYLMNSAAEGLPVALQGRVPCRVMGTIVKGDMLVSSSTPGVAVACGEPRIGSVIGKALENYDSQEVGIIEVVVGRT
jgi:hypothetical protein